MTTTTHAHKVAPARLQAPGAVAHKEQPLMSNQHRTDDTTRKTAAERAFWTDLRQLTNDHDTGDLSLAAQLVHDAVGRAAGAPTQDDDQARNAETFWVAAAAGAGPSTPAVEAAVERITETVNNARRLDAIENKLDAIIDRIGLGANDESLSETVDRLEDRHVEAAVASLRRDRLVLEAVEGPTGRTPWVTPPHPHLDDDMFNLDVADALGGDVVGLAAALVRRGGTTPITIDDDGNRRA